MTLIRTLRRLAGLILIGLPALAGLASAGVQAAEPVETTRVLSRESVVARFADAQSRFIDVDGVNVHYKDQGSGPVVLLVHGTMGDLADWDGWAAELSRSYRVLRLDLPSFGLTGPLRSGNYSIDRMLSLVDAFMDLQGAERFAIAGTSYGGLVAFRYAATRTERITALILTNSAGIETGKGPAPAGPAAPKAVNNVYWDPVVTARDVELNLRNVLVDHRLITPLMIERKLAFLNTRGRGEESAAGRSLYERGDPQRVLAHVRAPSLIIWGAANQALSPRTADDFAAALKNACRVEKVLIPEAGHLTIVDQPAQSVQLARNFLDQLAKPGACRSPAPGTPTAR